MSRAVNPRLRVVHCERCKRRCRYAHSRGHEFVGFRCVDRKCDYSVELAATASERKFLKGEFDEMMRRSTAIHEVSHAFDRKFQKTVKSGRPFKFGKKKIQPKKVVWRWTGYALMKRIEKYVEEHPEILVVGVDDDYFASSDLVLIPHNDKKTGSYFGTSVVYVPQCTGEAPVRFFLYPGHARCLVDALRALSRTYRGVIGRKARRSES